MAVLVLTAARSELNALVKNDETLLTSIDYALTRGGPPVQELRDANLSGAASGMPIFLCAHGSRASITGWTGEQIAAKLTDQATGLPARWTGTLFFLSCYAGADRGGSESTREADSSVIADLSRRLAERHPDVAIVGATGPTVKANSLGDTIYVIKDPNKTTAVKNSLAAQDRYSLARLTPLYLDWLQTARQTAEPSIETRARQMANILQERMPKFVADLTTAGALYSANVPADRDAMMRVYIGGARVTDATRRDNIIDAARRNRVGGPPPVQDGPRPQSGGQTHVYTFEQMQDAAAEMRKRHAAQSAQWHEEFENMVRQLAEILQDDC
jgi:hypothetical protein